MSAPDTTLPPSRIESAVAQIRLLLERGRFTEALAATRPLLAEVPENRDVLYMAAVAERCLNRTRDALSTLQRLQALHPRFARLFQERGHCHLALRDAAAAIAAYLQAVNINPALPASWQALQGLFRLAGRDAESRTAASHVAILATLPVAVVTARGLLVDGDLHAADRLVRQFLQTQPAHVEGMRLLAQIGIELDALEDAEFLLESVLVFAPDYQPARVDYVNVLVKRHRHAKALEEITTLLELAPNDRNYRTLQATAHVGLGDHAAALAIFGELSSETPQTADLHLSIAHALKTLGRQQEAIESYRAAARVRSDYGDAYWSLANLKTYRFTDAEIDAMRAAEAAPGTASVDRYHLCFALGKALEDRADYETSFACYERGNSLKRAEISFDIEPIERNTRLQKSICTREFFAARAGLGCPDTAPIFIVGLPRSGSTLLEQILASHSQVEGTMELADIPRLVQKLQGREPDPAQPRYPGKLCELTAVQLEGLGAGYIGDTLAYRSGRPFFIDKMPNNFRHIGLIHLILPNAKIIDARRAAMACCFGNFKQLFASGQEFTYSMSDIARYYRTYLELMDHWNTVLPGRVLRVDHESVVADLERNVRRLLDFCGLRFESGCLEFHNNARSVRTASSEQVRRPLYTSGLEQWRNYAPWLDPLERQLAQAPAW